MATKTSAAVGTAAQFMPQPDSDYQARLQGVQGVRGQAPKDTQEGMMADSLGGALSAYLDFSEKQDRRFEAQMAEAAENMVNAATREDVERLTSVEIAQKYGYGTLVDNPYFEAMVSKMRGVRLMSTADAEYNQLYGDNQAESMEAEQQRYEEFMAQKRDDYLQHSPSMNFTAFDDGFYSKKSESIARLMSNRSERDVADRLTEVVATTGAQLNTLIYDAARFDVAGIKEQLQGLINPYRLSNAQPAARYKLIEDAMIGLADTGLYTAEQLQDIADSVMVDTRLDGTEVPISSLVGMQTISDLANEAHKNHVTGKALDYVNKYKTHSNMDVYLQDIRKKYASKDPKQIAEARFMEIIMPQVQTAQNKYQAEQQKLLKMRAERAKARNKASAYHEMFLENIKLVGTNNATDAFNNREGVMYDSEGKRVPDDVIFAEWKNYFQEVQSNTNWTPEERLQELSRISGYSGVSSFIHDYQESVLNNMRQLNLDSLNGGTVEGTYVNMYNMYQVNPTQFAHAYGDKMAQAMRQVRRLALNSGEDDAMNALARGLWHWVQVERLPQDQKQQANNQFSSWESAMRRDYGSLPTIAGITNLADGTITNITADDLYNSATYDELTTWNIMSGMSPADAAAEAGNDIRDNWMLKWNGLLPKTLFYDFYPAAASESNALYLGNKAINALVGSYFNDDDVRYREDYNTGRYTLTFYAGEDIIEVRDTYNPNRVMQITKAQLANQMAYMAELTPAAEGTVDNSSSGTYMGSGNWWEGNILTT